MSRQMRRHPVATKPTKPQPIKPSLRTQRAVTPARAGKRSLRQLARPAWLDGVMSEMRKVQWPTWNEAWNMTIVVIVVCIAFGAALGLCDFFFQWVVQNTLAR